jgi:hypothetical protein
MINKLKFHGFALYVSCVKEKNSYLALWMIALGFWLIALPWTFG